MRVSAIAAIAIFLAAYLGAMLSHAGQQSNLDDDRVYLYSANFAVSAPERYRAESARWSERLSAAGYHEESLARFNFRSQYVTNYVAQSAVVAAIRQVWPWQASGLEYAVWFRTVVVASGLILAAFGVAMAAWMFARLPLDQRMAALFGFVGLAALAFLPVLLFYRISTSIDLLYPLRALTLLVQPGHELTPFGVQNRNVATMLLVAATFARWRDDRAAAYWLVFAAATMHATYGALILLIMLGLDVALDPRRLWKPGVLAPIAATALWGAVFGVSFGAFTAPMAALFLFLGAIGAVLAVGMLPLDRLAPVRTLRGLPPRRGEAVVLGAAVLAVLAAVAVAASLTSGLERIYIVDELSGRPLGLLRVPLLLALAAIVTAALPERLMRPLLIAAAAGAIASIPVGLLLLKMRCKPTPGEAEILAALPQGPANGARADSDTERAVYYSIAHAIDSAPR